MISERRKLLCPSRLAFSAVGAIMRLAIAAYTGSGWGRALATPRWRIFLQLTAAQDLSQHHRTGRFSRGLWVSLNHSAVVHYFATAVFI